MIKSRSIGIKILSIVLWIAALIHIYPIVIILISSLKTKQELAENPFGFPGEITFQYFSQAFKTMHYVRSFFNTVFIASVTVLILLLISSMAAYAIARKKNRFYNALYIFFLAGLIVPFQMTMIPLYKVMLATSLISTYQGMIFIYLGILTPFSIFLLTGFINTVPIELEEAAQIDGCGLYLTFFGIVLPLLKPTLSTVAILNFLSIWNDFLAPMLYLQNNAKMTLTVQLASFRGLYSNDWSLIFSGVCMIVIPMLVLYLFVQKYIISGITAGAVKG